MQELVPTLVYLPAEQSSQLVPEELAWYFPIEQLTQSLRPVDEYEPASHATHATAPPSDRVPAAQLVHDAKAACAENIPGLQAEQLDEDEALSVGSAVPAGQSVQFEASALL